MRAHLNTLSSYHTMNLDAMFPLQTPTIFLKNASKQTNKIEEQRKIHFKLIYLY